MPVRTHTRHDPYAALRSRDFRVYVLTNFLVVLGTQMASMAVGWELYGKTGSPLDLGLVGLFQVLPFLAFGLLGGNVADRYDRRWIVLLSTLLYLVGLAVLADVSWRRDNFPHFNLWVFACLFVMGLSTAFYIPSKQALLPQLVHRRDLANAVTWGSGTFQVASVMGPALCGWVLERFPPAVVYLASLATELLFAAAVLTFKPQAQTRSREPISLKSLGDGAKFVWNTKPILATLTLDLFAVLLGGCTALMPIFAKDILHSGPGALGWLLAAPSIGAFLMAMLLAQKPLLKKPGKAMLGAVAGFGLATIVFGLSKNLWLSLAMMFIIGALDNISVVVRGTLVQVLTPDRLLGRVQSVNFLFISSSNNLGAFESGTVAALLGTVPSVVLGGIGSILIVMGASYLWPQVLQLKSLHRPQPSRKSP